MRKTSRGLQNPSEEASVGRRFRNYKSESEKRGREADVSQSPDSGRLIDVYRSFVEFGRKCRAEDISDWTHSLTKYSFALISLYEDGKTRYNRRDVEAFAIRLAEITYGLDQDSIKDHAKLSGPFLSALINKGKQSEFRFVFRHFAFPIFDVGFKNSRSLYIDGDVGEGLGMMMEGGLIKVYGHAGAGAGQYMKGGAIVIHGNTVGGAAYGMNGGKLIVMGDAIGEENYRIGRNMKGGEIHIHGELHWLSDNIEHGKVYHKGKLIVDK